MDGWWIYGLSFSRTPACHGSLAWKATFRGRREFVLGLLYCVMDNYNHGGSVAGGAEWEDAFLLLSISVKKDFLRLLHLGHGCFFVK